MSYCVTANSIVTETHSILTDNKAQQCIQWNCGGYFWTTQGMIAIHYMCMQAADWQPINDLSARISLLSFTSFLPFYMFSYFNMIVCSCNYIWKCYIDPIKQIDCKISCLVTNILHFWTIYSMWPANYCQSCHLKLVKFVNCIW